MKKLLLLVGLALIGVASWYIWETRKKPKDETPELPLAAAVSKYSPEFNASIDSVLNDYTVLSESFVRWDSAHIKTNAEALKSSMNKIQYGALKKDSTVYATATYYAQRLDSGLNALISGANLEAGRRSFHVFSQDLYAMLGAIRYDGGKVYLQECPMAFNDTETGIWVSKTAPIRNPYLGLHHPKYRSGMLECGETRDSLNFLSAVK